MNHNVNTIINAIDLSLGGVISQIKTNISLTFSGYVDAKINDLIVAVLNENIKEEELHSYIKNVSGYEKDFLYIVLKKTLDSKDRIVTFILAKLLSLKIKNCKLSYYEESLLANINTLVEIDFKNYLKIVDSFNYKDDYIEIQLKKDEEEISLVKFLNIGIVKADREHSLVGKGWYSLLKTNYSDEFYNLLQSYYV